MKEITLNGRTYLSTKRASEVTGYTTDYVGQLARGGVVDAEQVGRNWYVLEESIKKHKFGDRVTAVNTKEDDVEAPALEVLVQEADEKEEERHQQESVEEFTDQSQVSSEEKPVEAQESPEEIPAEEAAEQITQLQAAWDEWYKKQKTVPDQNSDVFLSDDEASQEEEAEEVPVRVAPEVPQQEEVAPEVSAAPAPTPQRVEEAPEREGDAPVPSPYMPTQSSAVGGLVAGTLALLLVAGLVVGGGYIVVRNDLSSLSAAVEGVGNYVTGTTTFERDSR